MNTTAWFVILIAAISFNLFLSLVVYLNKRNRIINRIFSFFVFSVIIWIASNFFADMPQNIIQGLFWSRSAFLSASLIASSLFYFSLVFPKIKKVKNLTTLGVISSSVIMAILCLTPLIVKDVELREWGANVIPGSGYFLFPIFFLSYIIASFITLILKYRHSKSFEKLQIQYLFFGLFISISVGAVTNLLHPLATGTNQYVKLGSTGTIFFTGFTAYAMLRYRLMDIRLLTLKLVVYSSAVALLIGGVVLSVALVYVKYQLITNLYLLTVMTGFSSVLGFYFILRYFPRLTDKIFAKGRYNPQELQAKLDHINLAYARREDLTKNWLKTILKQMKITRAAFVSTASSQVSQVEEVGFKPHLKKQTAQALANCITKNNSLVVFDELEDSPFKNLLRELGIEVLSPIKIKDQVIGILVLGEKKSGDMYSSQDLNLFEEFSSRASVALERSKVITKVTLLYKQAEKIISNEDLKEVLDTTIDSAFLATDSEGGSIMLLDKETNALSIKASRGIPKKYHYQSIKVGEGIAGRIALTREPLIIDSQEEKFKKFLKRDHIHSSMCVPLEVRDKLIGVLSINRIKNKEPFTKDDCDLVTTVATNVAQLIENARLQEEEAKRDKEVINVFIKAVEARDPYTSGHSQAVTKYSVLMAKEIGLREDEIKIIETASKLHDIGKIGVPDQILNKPGKLTEEEWQEIKKHPEIGEGLIMQYSNLEEILPIVRHHHEFYDGSGYPKGIAGEVIPLGARILAVADAFNAMTSDRPYRPALSLEEAIEELKKNSGTQFDPEVVKAFLRILEKMRPNLKVVKGKQVLTPT